MTDETRSIELCRLTAENKKMFAELSEWFIEAGRLNSEITALKKVIDQHAKVHAENIMVMDQMRRQGALIVYALDRALQLNEALFSFWPPDTPMHPNVSACKAQFDDAMALAFQRRGERS